MMDEMGHLDYTASLRRAMVRVCSVGREDVLAQVGDIAALEEEEEE